MLKRNQLDLSWCSLLNEKGDYEMLEDHVKAFRDLYSLNNPCRLVMMNDSDLDELFVDSNIKAIKIIEEGIVKYGDNDEILNKEEGEIVGYVILEQEGMQFVMDVLAADNECQLNDGFDFESLNKYKGE